MQKWTFRIKLQFIYCRLFLLFQLHFYISIIFWRTIDRCFNRILRFCKCILRPPLEYLFFKRNPLHESDFCDNDMLYFFVFLLIFGIPQPWLLGFFLLLIILIPSDIKDVYFDPKEMKTIPQIMGLNKSIGLIQLAILSSVVILLFS